MRNPMTRMTEEKILRKIVEIRDIMDEECPDYSMLDINIQPDYMSFFSTRNGAVDYALPNLSLHDRRTDGENFCRYTGEDGETYYEDVDDMIARERWSTHPGLMRLKLGDACDDNGRARAKYVKSKPRKDGSMVIITTGEMVLD